MVIKETSDRHSLKCNALISVADIIVTVLFATSIEIQKTTQQLHL